MIVFITYYEFSDVNVETNVLCTMKNPVIRRLTLHHGLIIDGM